MKKLFFIFAFISLISAAVFAQDAQNSQQNQNEAGADSADAFAIIPQLDAEETANLPSGRTSVVFKTNVKNCRIFLNGNFQGLSKLTLTNLVEGYYLLHVEKEGYEFQENFIYVEREKSKTFYIELQPNEETKKRQEERENRSPKSESSSASVQSEQNSDSAAVETLGDAK